MKRIAILTALILTAASAFGQAARVDIPLLTSGPSVPITGGALPQTLWVADSLVYVCTHPSATLAACQAAPVTTYTDSTEGTTCPPSTQMVQLPGNTCTASSGVTANVGFWYGGGLVDYWVVSPYGNYGPFTVNPPAFTGPVTGAPNLQVTPDRYGTVDRTGVASSATAVRLAINTGNQVVFSPGIYNVCGLPPYVTGMTGVYQLTGLAAGPQGSHNELNVTPSVKFTCASGDMFVMPSSPPNYLSGYISGIEMTETSSANSGHIINLGSTTVGDRLSLTNLTFTQANPSKSWITGAAGCQECKIDEISGYVAAGNTVPAIQLDGDNNSLDIGRMNITSQGVPGSYSAHYLIEINKNSGAASNIHIHDSFSESATAGFINLNNVTDASIDDVFNYDQPTTPTAPFITIGSALSQVELKSVSSNYGTASIPDLVCPAGVCEFHNTALQYASLGGVILDQRSLPTAHYLDYTPAQQTDAALMGVWSTKDGFSGGGMTGNLLTGSDGLTTSWASSYQGFGSPAVVVTGQTDPLGGASASQITFALSSSNAGNSSSSWYQTLSPVPANGIFTESVWVKACTGTATFQMWGGSDVYNTTYTATTTWQRYYSTQYFSGSPIRFYIGVDSFLTGFSGAITSCLDVYGAQFTPGTAINPYVSTTYAGAAVPIAPGEYVNGMPVTNVLANIVPAAGQIPVGNAGGTAYAPVAMSGDCVLASTGAITCTKTNGSAFGTGAFATIANYAPLASTPQSVYNTPYTATMSASTGTLTTLTLAASSGSVQKYRVSVSASENAAGTGTCTTPGTIALTLAYTDADSGYSVSSGNVMQMTWAGLTISNTLPATASINANSVWRGLPFDIKVASGSAVTLTISQQTGSSCTTTTPVIKITPEMLSLP